MHPITEVSPGVLLMYVATKPSLLRRRHVSNRRRLDAADGSACIQFGRSWTAVDTRDIAPSPRPKPAAYNSSTSTVNHT